MGYPISHGADLQRRGLRLPASNPLRSRLSLVDSYNFNFSGELLAGSAVRVVDCGDVSGDPLDIPATVGRLILSLIHAMVEVGQFD
ncbi:MAG: hypothetical protein GX358_01465 [candidate division WS1 bacterium]|nr:hypothetical protein [candidate division WS1 bacterium]